MTYHNYTKYIVSPRQYTGGRTTHHQHKSIHISRVARCTASVGLTKARPNYVS